MLAELIWPLLGECLVIIVDASSSSAISTTMSYRFSETRLHHHSADV